MILPTASVYLVIQFLVEISINGKNTYLVPARFLETRPNTRKIGLNWAEMEQIIESYSQQVSRRILSHYDVVQLQKIFSCDDNIDFCITLPVEETIIRYKEYYSHKHLHNRRIVDETETEEDEDSFLSLGDYSANDGATTENDSTNPESSNQSSWSQNIETLLKSFVKLL